MGSYEVSLVSLCHSIFLHSTEGWGFFSRGSPFCEPWLSRMLVVLLKVMAYHCATSALERGRRQGHKKTAGQSSQGASVISDNTQAS